MAHVPPDAPAPDGAAVQAAFARLQRQFVAGLQQRWAELVSAPQGPGRSAVLHRLAGAAGAYGFEALSEAARSAERAGGTQESIVAVRALIEAAGATL